MTRYYRWATTGLLMLTLLAGGALCALAQGTGQLVIVPKKADPNQLISFSFVQADIDDVLRFLADASGKIVFKDSSVSTTLTIRNQSRIKVSEAIRLVRILLSFKGFAIQETPDALIVTTAEVSKRKYGNVSVGKDVSSIPPGNEIITHIFPLANVDAVRLQQELLPLFPAASTTIIADGDTNSLIVVDDADVVRRIGALVAQLDRNLADEVNLKVIPLKFADATEVARYLTDLFKPDDQTAAAGGAQRPGGGGFPGGGFPGGGGAGAGAGAGAARAGSLTQLRGRVRFAADQRSNALLVYASPGNIKQVEDIVAQIDVNLKPRVGYEVVDLKFADASALSDQLNQLLDPSTQTGNNRGGGFGGLFFGGGGTGNNRSGSTTSAQDIRVVPDVRTNSIIITAPIDGITGVTDLIKRLDTPSQVKDVVRVFQLQNAIASEVTTTLRNLFQGTQQTGGVGFGLFGGGNRTQIPPNSPLDLLRQVTIVANDQTNQLLVSGPAQTFPVIENLIEGMNGLDRRLPQVFIEVVIADVTLDNTTKFGIEWNATSGTSAFGTNFGLTSPTADSTGFRYSIVSKNFQATLQALGSTNKLKVISTPHILVTDNSPALVTIGESIPYAGQTTITNGVAQSSVAFQDVAITLNVTPHISPGNHILMDIDQVVNNLIGFINIGQGQTAPRTTNRRAGTTVIVKNNQTVVLGGIISKTDQKTVSKVPLLGDIPILGQFFRNSTIDHGRSELVVFLTPHVVREPEDADQLRDYERQRLEVDPLKMLDAPFVRPLEIAPGDLKRMRKPVDPLLPSGDAPVPDRSQNPALPEREKRDRK